MITRALFAGAGFVCVCVTLAAGPLPVLSDGLARIAPDAEIAPEFTEANVSLAPAWPGLPTLGLTDGGQFSYPGAFGWVEAPAAVLPVFRPVEPRRARVASAKAALDYEGDALMDLGEEKPDLFYTGGEVGFVYGRYTGKGGGSIKQGYFLSEIGNDKFHLTVGASFTEDEGRYRNRRGR